MQREKISFDSLTTTTTAAAAAQPHFSRGNPFLSPTSPPSSYLNSDASFYSSLFQTYSPTSSDAASFDGGDADRRLRDASCVLAYQQLYNRHAICLAELRDSIDEVEALHGENESLRLANADLTRRVALLFSRDRLLAELNRLSIAPPPPAAAPIAVHRAAAPSPQPLAEHNRVDRRSVTERVSLPKSISVRSRGYLKMIRPAAAGRDTARQKTVSQLSAESQRVYVAGAKKEEEALELDVYNQGMLKTELCNKWQETGACPYGENCQFAHGIKELRPVIRHPRYKTEVCRMVLSGDICPYGHRCHFRHSLTEQERLMAAPSPS